MSAQTEVVDAVVEQVRSWPAQSRIALARRVLETLEFPQEEPVTKKKGPPARQVLGIWNRSGYAPSDEELERILAEELQKKYAP